MIIVLVLLNEGFGGTLYSPFCDARSSVPCDLESRAAGGEALSELAFSPPADTTFSLDRDAAGGSVDFSTGTPPSVFSRFPLAVKENGRGIMAEMRNRAGSFQLSIVDNGSEPAGTTPSTGKAALVLIGFLVVLTGKMRAHDGRRHHGETLPSGLYWRRVR
jgi:hypothetical protein